MNSGSIRGSAPPWPASTIPVRRCTTRRPAADAGAVRRLPRLGDVGEEPAARRATTRRAPRRRDRRRSRSPSPTAAPAARRRARPSCRRAAWWPGSATRAPVRLYSSLHRLSPMPAPARLTTASMPTERRRGSSRPARGSQPISPAPGAPRTIGTASCPAARSAASSAVPMRPWEPVTATRTSERVRAARRGPVPAPNSPAGRGPVGRLPAADDRGGRGLVTDGGSWQPPEPDEGAPPPHPHQRRRRAASPRRRSIRRRPTRRPSRCRRCRWPRSSRPAPRRRFALARQDHRRHRRRRGDPRRRGLRRHAHRRRLARPAAPAHPRRRPTTSSTPSTRRTSSALVDVLLPGERDTFRQPLQDLVGELKRLEVLSSDADLSKVGGIDISITDRDRRRPGDERRRHRQPRGDGDGQGDAEGRGAADRRLDPRRHRGPGPVRAGRGVRRLGGHVPDHRGPQGRALVPRARSTRSPRRSATTPTTPTSRPRASP